MKRAFWTVLLALGLLLCSACAAKAGPLTLPAADEVTGVRLEYAGESVTRSGPGWIGLLLENMAAAEPTRKPTVQDVPDKDDLAAAHLVLADGGEKTFFFYPEKGKWYLERPYEGVYEIPQTLWVMVTDTAE